MVSAGGDDRTVVDRHNHLGIHVNTVNSALLCCWFHHKCWSLRWQLVTRESQWRTVSHQAAIRQSFLSFLPSGLRKNKTGERIALDTKLVTVHWGEAVNTCLPCMKEIFLPRTLFPMVRASVRVEQLFSPWADIGKCQNLLPLFRFYCLYSVVVTNPNQHYMMAPEQL